MAGSFAVNNPNVIFGVTNMSQYVLLDINATDRTGKNQYIRMGNGIRNTADIKKATVFQESDAMAFVAYNKNLKVIKI
jgi:hypothetical protein